MSTTVQYLSKAGFLDRFFINGEWRQASGTERAAVVNPATEQAIADIALGDERDLEQAVQAAKAAGPGWAAAPLSERAQLLGRIHALIYERLELFAQALTAEMGAPINYARQTQVPLAAEHMRAAKDNLLRFPFLKQRGTTAILREPIGVCGLITPWNWPLYQVTAKVGPALAAGCTVVLKPSELSPLSALLLAEVIHEAGCPPGVFNLVNGSGPVIGAGLASHPAIAMISITGSNRAGVLVAQAAAPTVKRVAQELGGKSPNVLLPDADFGRVVALGVGAAFRNVGQSCSAPTRMLVPRARLAEVEALAVAAVAQLVVGDPLNEQTTHGPIANLAQFERVQKMIRAGLEEGAKLVLGGPGRPDGLTRGFFARPTIFSEVRTQMRIAQEEIFGPVLSILPYDSVDEAVEIANDTIYGLGAHVQGADLDRARAIAARIRSGQVHINHPAVDLNAPFGGYKQSGNGREYGIEGIEEYLETKAVLGYFVS